MLTWNDDYSVGVEAMDAQHRRWIEIINEFEGAVRRSADPDEIARTLDAVMAYTHVHFSAEERLMEESGFPDLESHRALHRAFVESCEQMRGAAETGGQLQEFLARNLRSWLVTHIMLADKRYGEYINSQAE